MLRRLTLLAALLPIAACHGEVKDGNGSVASITIGNDEEGNGDNAQSVSVNVPGFAGKMDIPGLHIGGADAKIEDMPLFPGTKLNGIAIRGEAGDGSGGHSRGDVDMGFTAPGDPGKLVAWYRDQAQKNGWTVVPPAGGHLFEATRPKEGGTTRFALQAAPKESGSAGHILVQGQ